MVRRMDLLLVLEIELHQSVLLLKTDILLVVSSQVQVQTIPSELSSLMIDVSCVLFLFLFREASFHSCIVFRTNRSFTSRSTNT